MKVLAITIRFELKCTAFPTVPIWWKLSLEVIPLRLFGLLRTLLTDLTFRTTFRAVLTLLVFLLTRDQAHNGILDVIFHYVNLPQIFSVYPVCKCHWSHWKDTYVWRNRLQWPVNRPVIYLNVQEDEQNASRPLLGNLYFLENRRNKMIWFFRYFGRSMDFKCIKEKFSYVFQKSIQLQPLPCNL